MTHRTSHLKMNKRIIFLLALFSLFLLMIALPSVRGAERGMALLSLILIGIVAGSVWRNYITPLEKLKKWVYEIRGGNLSSRIRIDSPQKIHDLAQDFNVVGEMLESLSRDTEQQLQKFTEHTEQAYQITIMEERAHLANELHDSLAQTLASSKLQIRVLDESVHQGNDERAWAELEKIENSIDQAYKEIRELIGYFRSSTGKPSFVESVETVVNRFNRECEAMQIFLQKEEWFSEKLPAEYELHILRIIQEALTNAKKHSQASAVRVMMKGDKTGKHLILIEDDGIGIAKSCFIGHKAENTTGEHVGLNILTDRAKQIKGELRIESEPGEGARVAVEFYYPEKPGGEPV